MIIDFHAHYVPQDWPSKERSGEYWPTLETDDQGGILFIMEGKSPQKLEEIAVKPELRLKDMDRDGINMQVISPPPYLYAYELPKQHGLNLCRWLNDSIAAVVQKWRGRFLGFGVVPLQDISTALEEADRAIRVLGLKGLAIGTSVNGKNLDEEEFEPFWGKIDELEVPLFLNSYGGVGGDRLKKYSFSNLIGNGMELSIAAGSLIFGGVLDRHPRITFCFSLGGGSLIAQIYRMNHGYKVAQKSYLKKDPIQYLEDLYFDTLTHSETALRMLIREAGIDHVLLGSDYPFEMGDSDSIRKIREVVREEKGLNQILYQNAVRILRLG